jgi:hypothetical protein
MPRGSIARTDSERIRKRKDDRPSLENGVLPDIKKRRLTLKAPRTLDTPSSLGIRRHSNTINPNTTPSVIKNGIPVNHRKNVRFQVCLPLIQQNLYEGVLAENTPGVLAKTLLDFKEGHYQASWPSPVPSSVDWREISEEGETCQSSVTFIPAHHASNLHISLGRKASCRGDLDRTSTTSESTSLSLSVPIPMPMLRVRDDITSRSESEFDLDGGISAFPSSEEEKCEDCGEMEEGDWAELSSEEEVELQLEPDSDSEMLSDGEALEDEMRAYDWNFPGHDDERITLKPLEPPSFHQQYGSLQHLLKPSLKQARIPVSDLFKARLRRSQAILYQGTMKFQGKDIIFSRLV